MIVKTIFSGFGGQGVLLMGYSLAHGAMNQGSHVTFLPSYGAEMRGGTANCTVCVGDEDIASPIASEPDHVVAMNMPSLYTFQNRLAAGGTIFLNASIISVRPTRTDVAVCAVPCTEMADEAGNPRGANVVMMGAFLAKTKMVDPGTYLAGLETIMGGKKKALFESNRRAFEAGHRFVRA